MGSLDHIPMATLSLEPYIYWPFGIPRGRSESQTYNRQHDGIRTRARGSTYAARGVQLESLRLCTYHIDGCYGVWLRQCFHRNDHYTDFIQERLWLE